MHKKVSIACLIMVVLGFGGAVPCQLVDLQVTPRRSTIYYVKPLVVFTEANMQGVQSYA